MRKEWSLLGKRRPARPASSGSSHCATHPGEPTNSAATRRLPGVTAAGTCGGSGAARAQRREPYVGQAWGWGSPAAESGLQDLLQPVCGPATKDLKQPG